jgi:hypothetical protein
MPLLVTCLCVHYHHSGARGSGSCLVVQAVVHVRHLQAWRDGVAWWHTVALLEEQVAEASGAPLVLACLRGWLAYVRVWEHVKALGAAYERAR